MINPEYYQKNHYLN